MADHIRTLANDKFKLERRLKDLEKEIKELRLHLTSANTQPNYTHTNLLQDEK